MASRTSVEGCRDDDDLPFDEVGEDPDPRFTFANERTFLAWNRTALALVVTGLAVVQFLKHGVEAARLAVAVPMIILGAVVAFMSLSRWEARERAMRLKRPLPSNRLPGVVAAGVGIVAVLAAVLAVVNVIADG
jgi:putative membrane protein